LIEWRDDSVRHTTSPLAAIAYGKLSFHVLFQFSRPRPNRKIVQPLRRVTQPVRSNHSRASPSALAGGWCVSLLFETSGTAMPRLRNFDTEPQSPYCYEVEPDNRLESVANAHTAADLHVRPVS
jgi:hypothetical protein